MVVLVTYEAKENGRWKLMTLHQSASLLRQPKKGVFFRALTVDYLVMSVHLKLGFHLAAFL